MKKKSVILSRCTTSHAKSRRYAAVAQQIEIGMIASGNHTKIQ